MLLGPSASTPSLNANLMCTPQHCQRRPAAAHRATSHTWPASAPWSSCPGCACPSSRAPAHPGHMRVLALSVGVRSHYLMSHYLMWSLGPRCSLSRWLDEKVLPAGTAHMMVPRGSHASALTALHGYQFSRTGSSCRLTQTRTLSSRLASGMTKPASSAVPGRRMRAPLQISNTRKVRMSASQAVRARWRCHPQHTPMLAPFASMAAVRCRRCQRGGRARAFILALWYSEEIWCLRRDSLSGLAPASDRRRAS